MSSFTDRQIHPNSKLETQLKPGKFHKTKTLRSKRKTASFNTFEEKEAFVKKITSNKAMQKPELQAPAMKKQKFPENDSSLARKIIKKNFSSDGKFKSIKKPTNECIPRIEGLTDYRLPLLKLGGAISITYLSLFSLEVIFSPKEYILVKQSAPGFRPGWLQDEVIAAYLYNLRQKHLNMEFIYPSEALALNKFKKLRNLLAQVDSNKIEYICIPYNDSGMHWILAVPCVKVTTILVLDPMVNEYQPFNKAHQGAVYVASEILNHRFQKQVEKVESIKHTLQKDTNSRGFTAVSTHPKF